MYNTTTFKNVFQYQMSKFNKEKPQLLLHQPNKSQPNNINALNKQLEQVELNTFFSDTFKIKSQTHQRCWEGANKTLCTQERRGRSSDPDKRLGQTCLSVSVSCGSQGQQQPAAGAGALTADLGGAASGRRQPQTTHKLENNYNKEVLTLLQKFQGPQQISQPGDLAKGLRIPREFEYESQWDLITEFPKDWGNRLLDDTIKPHAHQDPVERSSDPTRDWARLPYECPGVSGGVVGRQQPVTGSGTPTTTVLGATACAGIGFLKEVAIITIIPTIVWPQAQL